MALRSRLIARRSRLFTTAQKVLFQHCDPAGIVFYPRYFEMMNAVIEEWFEQGVGLSFARMHGERDIAIPLVSTNATFHAPSRLGDVLAIDLAVARLGDSSMTLELTARCGGEARFTASLVIVHIGKRAMRPAPWPDDLRSTITKQMETL
jgi:4-hydroxybenzoyl-CoA thioesterase